MLLQHPGFRVSVPLKEGSAHQPRNNATINAVCCHGAISFELGDSILIAAIVVVAIISPQTAHADPDWNKCPIPLSNVGSHNLLS
jgi:hypothetical protein